MRTDLHPALRRSRALRLTLGVLAAVVIGGGVLVASIQHLPRLTSKLNTTSCLPFHQPTTVAALNRVVATYRAQPAFRGGDVGASTRLQDGRELYVFGDTLRAARYPGARFVRNSMLVFGPGCAGVIQTPTDGAVIPNRPDGVGYWPMSIAAEHRKGYDLVGVMAQRVQSTGPTDADFRNLGPAIAIFRVYRGATPQLVNVFDLGADNPSRKRPTWGAAGAIANGWVYLYGTSNPQKPLVFGWALSVARTRIQNIIDMHDWQFWDGRHWQGDPAKAATLIPAVHGVSQTLSVVRQGHTWYAISKQDDFLGKYLVVWSAPKPTGPFTPEPPAAYIPSSPNGRTLRYMPIAHPDLLPRTGSMVVSISRNSASLALIDQDPTRYRPYFIRIPLHPAR